MLNLTRRRHLTDARRAMTAARDQLSRMPLAPGMAARVDHHYDRGVGYRVTVTAWWDHPVTGARITARDTVPAAAGPIAAEQAAEHVVTALHARLRADRVEAAPAVHVVPDVPAPPTPPADADADTYADAAPAVAPAMQDTTTGKVHTTPLHLTGASTTAEDEDSRARMRAALQQTAATYRRGDFA